jgi:hypothetical protein
LASNFDFKFSQSFHGVIWSTLADTENGRLFLEVRNAQQRTVSFSALNLRNYQWLWKDISLDEPWWIGLRAVSGDILLLTVYTDVNNPDKKSVVAFDIVQKRIIWWQNGFSLTSVNKLYVRGVDSRFPEKEAILDVFTGKGVPQVEFDLEDSQNFPVIRPFQYEEGTAHFDTVKDFLNSRLGILPVAIIEYLEFESLIIVSVFLREQGLANYLYGFNDSGEMLIEEKLGDNLIGVGLDTFFIFSGHLVFVKNKNELTSYKII